jgi:hypothetical protein
MKPIKPIYVLILIITFAAAGFYGGVTYQKSKAPSFASFQDGQGQGMGGGRRFGGQAGQSMNAGMRPVSGQVVNQSDNSITIKLSDGSSKIVNLTGQTTINKSSKGSVSDLKSGEQVTAFGTTNSDGSVTAQMVSVGNRMMMMRSGGNPPASNGANGSQQPK